MGRPFQIIRHDQSSNYVNIQTLTELYFPTAGNTLFKFRGDTLGYQWSEMGAIEMPKIISAKKSVKMRNITIKCLKLS